MIIRKAYQYRLKTNFSQESFFRQQAGCCRYVWNKALALQKERLDAGEKVLRYGMLTNLLTLWKHEEESSWLSKVHSQPLQQTLKFLDKALMEAFDKSNPKRFPKFKKKGQSDSFRYPQGFKLDNDRVYLPKVGWVRFHKSRDIEGIVRNITVSRRGAHWYVSIQTEIEVAEPVHPSVSTVGIDMGVARFATLSDGSFLEPLNSFKKHETALRKAQQSMSRKVKFSQNWKKAKARIQSLHVRIGDTRNDYLHKASSTISKNHAIVCMEDLQVRNMSRSAAGTTENPGKKVRAKSGLNKSILDQGWYEFRRQLDYKLEWSGGYLIVVPPHNTSRTCPHCGHVSADNRKTQARFVCVECGYSEHADLVGAINILRAGHARCACQVSDAVRTPAAGTLRGELVAASGLP